MNLYADDTSLYVTSDTLIHLIFLLRQELSIVKRWLAANKLTLNVSKTKFMLFGSKPKLANVGNFKKFQYTYGRGEILERVDHLRYLGVIIDKHLTISGRIS